MEHQKSYLTNQSLSTLPSGAGAGDSDSLQSARTNGKMGKMEERKDSEPDVLFLTWPTREQITSQSVQSCSVEPMDWAVRPCQVCRRGGALLDRVAEAPAKSPVKSAHFCLLVRSRGASPRSRLRLLANNRVMPFLPSP